jgi:hypothetical protein
MALHILSAARSSIPASCSQAGSQSTFGRGRQHFDFLTPVEPYELTETFGAAIHWTAMPFGALEHPAWKKLFGKLRSALELPTTEVIGNCNARARMDSLECLFYWA